MADDEQVEKKEEVPEVRQRLALSYLCPPA
jgi:hypothetical protein